MNRKIRPFSFLKLFVCGLFALIASSHSTAAAQEKVAIFVNNLAGTDLEPKAAAFESMLTGQLNGIGFSVISQNEVVNTLENAPSPESDANDMLSTQSSALRLAQVLGANYILVAHIISYNADVRDFSGSNIETQNQTMTLRVSYGFLDAKQGAGMTGDSFSVSETLRSDKNIQIADADTLNDLLSQASEKIATQLKKAYSQETLTELATAIERVPFSITVLLQGVQLPNVLLSPNSDVHISAERFPVEATGVTVALDGVVIGSAPGDFIAPSGLHHLQLSRNGFVTWQRTINVYSGFHLVASMDFDSNGLAQWQQISAFLQGLKDDASLSNAEVDVLKGKAQMLEQSGFKVDTTQAPSINLINSIWEPAVIAQPQTQTQAPAPSQAPSQSQDQ